MASTPSKVVQRGEETRTRILDAAEVLMGQRGYDGTSMRDITALAEVRLGLLHYHFGTKDRVLAACIDRKLDPLRAFIDSGFEEARAAGRLGSLDDCVRAFILPMIRIRANRDHPLHDFVVMVSHLMSAYRVPEVKPSLMRLAIISEQFIGAVREVMPEADEGFLRIATYLIDAALIFMMQDAGFLDDLSAHHQSADRLDQIAEAILRFFSAGMTSLVAPG